MLSALPRNSSPVRINQYHRGSSQDFGHNRNQERFSYGSRNYAPPETQNTMDLIRSTIDQRHNSPPPIINQERSSRYFLKE